MRTWVCISLPLLLVVGAWIAPIGVAGEPLRDRREILAALDQTSRYTTPENYNPLYVIRAVNLLQPLGKEEALAIIDEFMRVGDNSILRADGLNFVMRTLFEVPADPEELPPIDLWKPPETPAERKLNPRYPIAIEGDIPFLLHRPPVWITGPRANAAIGPLAYYRKHGTIRSRPLVPSDHPFRVLEEYAKSARWYYNNNGDFDRRCDNGRDSLAEQILALMTTVYQVERDREGDLPYFDDLKKQEVRLAEASKLQIRWDSSRNQFTFLDGKSLPIPDPDRYQRLLWKSMVSVVRAELTFERESRHYLSLRLREEFPVATATGRIFNVKSKEKSLYEFKTETPSDLKEGGVRISGASIRFDEGEELQGEVTVGGKTYLSPVFKP
ncbi:MAG: hypothetical protein U0903_05855 [Planctomycetales bacterium]